jgi:hypothetical protein
MQMINNMYSMMAGYGLLGYIIGILIIVLLVVIILWFIKQIKK